MRGWRRKLVVILLCSGGAGIEEAGVAAKQHETTRVSVWVMASAAAQHQATRQCVKKHPQENCGMLRPS